MQVYCRYWSLPQRVGASTSAPIITRFWDTERLPDKLSRSTWKQLKRRFLSLWFLCVSARWTWKLNLPNSRGLRRFKLNLWDLAVLSRAFTSCSYSSNPSNPSSLRAWGKKILRKTPQSQLPPGMKLAQHTDTHTHLPGLWLETHVVPPWLPLTCKHLYLGRKMFTI